MENEKDIRDAYFIHKLLSIYANFWTRSIVICLFFALVIVMSEFCFMAAAVS